MKDKGERIEAREQDRDYRERAFEELLAIAADRNKPDSVCIAAARTVLEMLR